ncbi:hypothetical protein L207DRAFT_637536 [Hyaloscypha variabilis F]|uniref:Uncharacterized protein n=1 Tax=Hyaloscypha variabilis (strain UAMH 11265 / GT02V1 / F) TaxID=1149755 RepID=A0A2J6R9D2_HYAVF|nr:hypothetical protein L207DRAFT_637536 [Hyaloscypha variabilis F]
MSFSQVKKYFLVPDLSIPAPPNSPLALGRVIHDKLNPVRCLNKNDSIAIPPDDVYKDKKTEWSHEAENQSSGRHSIWSRYIYGLFGWSTGATFDDSIISDYVFEVLETTFFEPSDDYIKDVMWTPSLESFLEASRFNKPVYMITGLKVARGVRAKSRKVSGIEGRATASATLGVVLGAQGNVEGETAGRLRQITADSFEGSTDIVIAYRLRKITCSRTMEVKHEEETSGAILGIEDEASGSLRSYHVATISREDAAADDSDASKMFLALDDVDEKECQCFVPIK